MDTTPNGWKIFDARTPILTYESSFGPGTANALAIGIERHFGDPRMLFDESIEIAAALAGDTQQRGFGGITHHRLDARLLVHRKPGVIAQRCSGQQLAQ